MPNTKDIDFLHSPVKMLLVSPNGLGKSIVAGSFHKAGPVHFEDSDIRMKPLAAYYPGVDISYDSWTSDNFRKFVDKIHAIIDGTLQYIDSDRKIPINKGKTWVVDSVTGFSITSITYQLKVKDKIKLTKGGLPATSWDEINGETVLFHEIIEAAQILYTKHGYNIIFTAHPVAKTEIVEGQDTAKKITSIAAYGNKIPSILPGFFDEIYNIELTKTGINKYTRRVFMTPRDGMAGKSVLQGVFPDDGIDITNKNFYEELQKEISKVAS